MLDTPGRRFTEEHILEFEDGKTIFSEGDDSREMYIIQQGGVVITRQFSSGELTLAALKRGDLFGEMSLLESLPRSATARARGRTKLVVLQPGGFLLKIRRDPTLAFEMLQQLSRRIRVTNEHLLRAVDQGGASRDNITSILKDGLR